MKILLWFIAACFAIAFIALHFTNDETIEKAVKNNVIMSGKRARLHAAFFGCPKLDDLDKIRELIVEKDFKAAARAAMSGGCEEMSVGTLGTVMDNSVFHGATCIRQTGEPDCVWIPSSVLEEAHR